MQQIYAQRAQSTASVVKYQLQIVQLASKIDTDITASPPQATLMNV